MTKLLWWNENGSTAVTLGVMAVPIVLAVGLGVDYAAMTRDRSIVQGIMDRAILAAAVMTDASEADLAEAVKDFVDQAQAAQGVDTIDKVDVAFPDADRIRVTITAHKPTSLFNVVADRFPYTVTNESFRGLSGKLEIVFALDNTYSMNDSAGAGTKLQALKKAAKSLVDKVAEEAGTSAKFGLVPFSNYVNVGTDRNRSWLDVKPDYKDTYKKNTWSNPPTFCPMVTRIVDEVPVTQQGTGDDCQYPTGTEKKSEDVEYTVTWKGCVGSRPHPLNLDNGTPSSKYPGILNVNCARSLTALTGSVSSIKAEIDAMTGIGETYIPGGLVWALNMLTPGAPMSEASAFDPDGQNLRPRKSLVLMTDGRNTLGPSGANGSLHSGSGKTFADGYTASLCANIKAKTIEIYTVAFQVTDDATRSLLRNCATDTDKYFSADNETALLDAFLKIAKSLKQVRLSR